MRMYFASLLLPSSHSRSSEEVPHAYYGMRGKVKTGWQCDEEGGLILLKIPKQISLPTSPPTPSHPLFTLPPELLQQLTTYLPPVDRVCLALTCKTLCHSLHSQPRLTPKTWARYMSDPPKYGKHLQPESFSLPLRLAHGWVPKKKYRYCWKCHLILPRNTELMRARMTMRRMPKHHAPKLGIEESKWAVMSKSERYEYILRTWAETEDEDSSVLYCDGCRNAVIEDPKKGMLHPVECPACMERSLTFTWRLSLAQQLRRFKEKSWEELKNSAVVVVGGAIKMWEMTLFLKDVAVYGLPSCLLMAIKPLRRLCS